jgi:hypothetical protein
MYGCFYPLPAGLTASRGYCFAYKDGKRQVFDENRKKIQESKLALENITLELTLQVDVPQNLCSKGMVTKKRFAI